MYNQFYGFREKPFRLTPDTDFFYLSSVHKQALAYLTYGLEDKQGFIAITGEVGSGKTTVIQVFLSKLKDTTKVAKINNTRVTSLQLLEMIVRDFGLNVQGTSKTELLENLNKFLLEQYTLGNYVLLIVDEAQNLSPSLLEEIRLLSNLETSKDKLLQIILAGQPELAQKLRLPQLRQLAQRITVSFHMTGLDRKEIEGYINYRLQVAGSKHKDLFTQEAMDRIAEFSRGIPRMINIICDAALLAGFVNEKRQVDEALVMEVIQELKTTQDIPVAEEQNLSTYPVSKVAVSNAQLEKRLDELSSKLEQTSKVIEQLGRKVELPSEQKAPLSETTSIEQQEVKDPKPEAKSQEERKVKSSYTEDPVKPGLLYELIRNSAHFPFFAFLLKVNTTGFSSYMQDMTNLILWIGTFLQAWFLSSWDRGKNKFLGNLISPFIYSVTIYILQGSLSLKQPELLVFWGYSLIAGFLQTIQPRIIGKRGPVTFFELLTRIALIFVLYGIYQLEKEGIAVTLNTLQGFFTEFFKISSQANWIEPLKSLQVTLIEFFRNSIYAYWIGVFLLLSVLYGLSKVLKIKK